MRCCNGSVRCGRLRSRMLGRRIRLPDAGLFRELLGCFEGVNLRLVRILLNNLVGLAGPVFENGDILQIVNDNARNNEIYA
jgi:hypothetical protein